MDDGSTRRLRHAVIGAGAEVLKAHMRTHLDLTLEEAVARLEGRYEDSIASYEEVHAQILAMADMLSDGIIARFPSRFVRGPRLRHEPSPHLQAAVN